MRVLWLCNVMLPAAAEYLKMKPMNKEGWLTGLSETLLRNQEDNGIALGICFPVRDGNISIRKEINDCMYYSFYEDTAHPEIYDSGIEESLKRIIDDFQPDMVHCFGTEYPHTLALTRVFRHPERILIGIQGVCCECEREYYADLPERVINRVTFRDFIRKDSIKKQKHKFALRAEHEKEAVRNVGHLTGRTPFDLKFFTNVNPNAHYYFMNETLRAIFYEGAWSPTTCEKHSIFMSQGDYPLKGLHYVLQAMPEIIRRYPDAKLYVAGNNITAHSTWKEKLKLSSYGKYLLELIKSGHLEEHVEFLGMLNAKNMKERFLKSNLYILASSVENSPNSLGEAMLLGVPSIAADVGGVSGLFRNNSDGLLYKAGNIKDMISKIDAIWQDKVNVGEFSMNETLHAATTHNPDKNYKRLLEVYQEICQ